MKTNILNVGHILGCYCTSLQYAAVCGQLFKVAALLLQEASLHVQAITAVAEATST